MLATVNRNTILNDTLQESFHLDEVDGYFYPMEPGMPLVRVYVAGTSYQIERRRNSGSAWMPIVTAEAAEFDAASFRAWRLSYPMVQVV